MGRIGLNSLERKKYWPTESEMRSNEKKRTKELKYFSQLKRHNTVVRMKLGRKMNGRKAGLKRDRQHQEMDFVESWKQEIKQVRESLQQISSMEMIEYEDDESVHHIIKHSHIYF